MSSFVVIAHEALAAATANLTDIGAGIRAADAAAAGSTTSLAAAAADEVSAAISRLFAGYAQEYQALSAQTALFHAQFVQALTSGGFLYAAAEAANTSPLLSLQHGVQAVAAATAAGGPVEQLTGRPLFGDGTHGAPGTGQAGGPGGWLFGNGGNGGSGAPGQPGGNGGSAFLFGNGEFQPFGPSVPGVPSGWPLVPFPPF
ncbi:hypothetical protein BST27_27165, partial [Mycobacterium intermedium]